MVGKFLNRVALLQRQAKMVHAVSNAEICLSSRLFLAALLGRKQLHGMAGRAFGPRLLFYVAQRKNFGDGRRTGC